ELAIQPALVEKGKALFASSGCANCHQMKVGGQLVESSLKAPALEALKGEGGCLIGSAGAVPQFALSAAQTAALSAAIKTHPRPNLSLAAVIARSMLTFNCY